MKVGIFRGSFDPIHLGHIFIAVQALQCFPLDQVWVLPVYNHPFGKNLTPFDLRFHMCLEACHRLGDVKAKDYDRNNESGHCLELLKFLVNVYPQHQFTMFGGTDVNSHNDKHKGVEEILKLCTVRRIDREGYSQSKYAIPNYSSSEVRQLVKDGQSIQGLVPHEVIDIINKHNLYKESSVVSKSS
jgi:nicotinate-nucleotide adenylyltransferase